MCDRTSDRRLVKVTFDDGDHLTTAINGSETEIRRYYIGNTFNLGGLHDPVADRLVRAVAVEFLDTGSPRGV